MASSPDRGIDLYWLRWTLGAPEWAHFRVVRSAARNRDRRDVYHSALEVRVPEGRFVIEQAPAWSEKSERGVVAASS
jgi:hypothetical protein